MRVLFASGIDGFCHRYEVLHRAEQLRLVGGEATVVSFTDPRLRAEAARHDLIFLYRVPETSAVALAIDEARAAGVAVVGAIDDLVFVDAAPVDQPHFVSEGVRLLRPGGVIVVHHAALDGRAGDPAASDAEVVAVREAARLIAEDERLTPVLVPLGDGILVAARDAE